MFDKHSIPPIGFVFAAAALLSACDDGGAHFASSRSDCVAYVSHHVLQKNRRRIPESLMADFERMNRHMAENACDVIVSECVSRPDGEMCRKLVSDYL